MKEYKKLWNIKNKDSEVIRKRIWNEENKEKITLQHKIWNQNNKDKCNIMGNLRRSRKKELLSTLTKNQWENIKLYFNNRCAYCNKETPLEQEHFISLVKGGEFTINNIICACRSCNSSKKDRNFYEWYPKHKSYSKQREKKILKFLGYANDEQQLRII